MHSVVSKIYSNLLNSVVLTPNAQSRWRALRCLALPVFIPYLPKGFSTAKMGSMGLFLTMVSSRFSFLSSHPHTHAGCFFQVKEAAEHALQAKNLALDVSIECLTLRESRRAIDVVRDPAEEELHREVKVIDKAKRELQQKVTEAFQQLW